MKHTIFGSGTKLYSFSETHKVNEHFLLNRDDDWYFTAIVVHMIG